MIHMIHRTLVGSAVADKMAEQRHSWRSVKASSTALGQILGQLVAHLPALAELAGPVATNGIWGNQERAASSLRVLDPWMRQADAAARNWQRWLNSQALWRLFALLLNLDITSFKSIQWFRWRMWKRISEIFRDDRQPGPGEAHWIAWRMVRGESVDLILARLIATFPEARQALGPWGLPHPYAPVEEFRAFSRRLALANANATTLDFPEVALHLAAQDDNVRLDLVRLGFPIPAPSHLPQSSAPSLRSSARLPPIRWPWRAVPPE